MNIPRFFAWTPEESYQGDESISTDSDGLYGEPTATSSIRITTVSTITPSVISVVEDSSTQGDPGSEQSAQISIIPTGLLLSSIVSVNTLPLPISMGQTVSPSSVNTRTSTSDLLPSNRHGFDGADPDQTITIPSTSTITAIIQSASFQSTSEGTMIPTLKVPYPLPKTSYPPTLEETAVPTPTISTFSASTPYPPAIVSFTTPTSIDSITTVSSPPQSLAPPPTATIASARQASRNATATPVVASVLPLVFIATCLSLFFWWRRQRKLREEKRHDLEREAVWFTGHTAPMNKVETKGCVHVKQDGVSKNTKAYAGKQNVNSAASQIESEATPGKLDYFSTPLTQTHCTSTIPRTSQIGLALTTPTSQNASSLSLADSIRTVLQNASRRLSNPFRDPVISVDGLKYFGSSGETVNTVAEEDDCRPEQSSFDTGCHTEQTSGLTKSNTPPEELARRWIEVLKLEAAQAEQAAGEAARRAGELKRKETRTDDSH